jgi:hypothetical protein
LAARFAARSRWEGLLPRRFLFRMVDDEKDQDEVVNERMETVVGLFPA